jgi:frataxin-like iron-binding protein CyaY
MEEGKFLQLSQDKLIEISDLIENNDERSIFDVEYSDGILNIEIFEDPKLKGKIYVINKHSASEKIWFSSPICGAKYFAYDEKEGKWLDDDKEELGEFLINELITNFNFKFKND